MFYIGVTIRCECYRSEPLKVKDKEYCIYMRSYGDVRRNKFVHG
jgi:hypothetical protein